VGSNVSSRERVALLAISLQADLAAVELFSALEEEGLNALLLRGSAIVERLYEDDARGYGDCDVLVPEHGREATEALLRRLGYVAYTALAAEQHWHRRSDRAEVDLHRAVRGVHAQHEVFWRAMWEHRDTIELRGLAVPVPDRAATAVVIALHAAQHGALVDHTLEDLRRALARWDADVWAEAAALAGEVDALLAFRQALAMLPAGVERLAGLGLEPSVTARSVMRERGIEVPDYLLESLPARERAVILLRRVWPSRAEISLKFDPRAAESTPRLLAVHARRIGRLPFRAAALALNWRRARRDAASAGGRR
jgi:hypothetical protein